MKKSRSDSTPGLNRRQLLAMLGALGLPATEAFAQDAATASPRSYRVVLENERVRVLEYKSRPGFGVCGEGMHYHPDHLTVSMTGAKLKVVATPGGQATFKDIPAGTVFFAPAETHSAEVIGGLGTRSYIIELKGGDWKPSTG